MDYQAKIFAGEALRDVEIIDVHVHHGGIASYQLNEPDGDDIVRTMDRLGMNIACCCGNSAKADWMYINEKVAKSLDKYPDRLKGYVVANPYYEEFDPAVWFQRSKGFLGLKILACVQGDIPINDPRFDRFYAYAHEHSLPVLVHTWIDREVNEAMDEAGRYPNARFIIAHAGLTNLPAKLALIEGMKRHDNVVMDTAISAVHDGALEWIVDKVGEDRVLYGSDFITFECSHILGRVAMSRLSDDAKEKIFSRNARQWLKL